jgi:HAD superfamily hydrolase (TIGR01459 family)
MRGDALLYQFKNSLEEMSKHYTVLLCDLWGCFHNGIQPYPQAMTALEAFRKNGGIIVFITNAPRPSDGIRDQLKAMGVPDGLYHDIVSSGDAARFVLSQPVYGSRCFHIGAQKDAPMFEGSTVERVSDMSDADFIFCTGLFDDETETPDDYADVIQEGIAKNLKFLCANPDIIAHRGSREIYCAGAIAQNYDKAGGEVVYFGKPHRPIYDLALQKARKHAEFDLQDVLAIGDGIHTDVLGAVDYGLDVAFVTSGIAKQKTQDGKQLEAFFKQNDCTPNYVMSALC